MQWSGGGDGIENDRLALSGDLGWSENTGKGQPRVGILDWGGFHPHPPPRGHLAAPGDIFGHHNSKWRALLASGR